MLTCDEVIWGFRYCLGRSPESEKTIAAHRNFSSWSALRSTLLTTPEFVAGYGFPGLKNRWVIAPVMGGERLMWVNLGDRYVSHACLLDSYEPNETRFIKSELKPGQVFLDVGSNIGWFTLLASTIVGDSGRVYAIEPRPDTADHLRKTIELNALGERVTMFNVGVSDRPGVAFLSWLAATDNPGGTFVSESEMTGAMVSCPVTLVTIDSLNIPKVDFVKIDIEGSEYRAMRGAEKLLKMNRPIVLSEVNPGALKNVSQSTVSTYFGLFADLSYRIFIVGGLREGEEIHDFPEGWESELLNVALIPAERAANMDWVKPAGS